MRVERVRCEIDGSPASSEAVRAALDYCMQHGAELELGVVAREGAFVPPQPAVGERLRRFQFAYYQLVQAIRTAREAGVVLADVRYGAIDPSGEAVRETKAPGATRVFLGRAHTWLGVLLTRRSRIEVEERALPGAV